MGARHASSLVSEVHMPIVTALVETPGLVASWTLARWDPVSDRSAREAAAQASQFSVEIRGCSLDEARPQALLRAAAERRVAVDAIFSFPVPVPLS